jgi:hypothetical protein
MMVLNSILPYSKLLACAFLFEISENFLYSLLVPHEKVVILHDVHQQQTPFEKINSHTLRKQLVTLDHILN